MATTAKEVDKLVLIERIIALQDPDILQEIDLLLNPTSELSAGQKKILDERYADYQANPGKGQPWAEVKAEIEANLRQRREQKKSA